MILLTHAFTYVYSQFGHIGTEQTMGILTLRPMEYSHPAQTY